MSCILMIAILLLSGCGSNNQNEEKVDDVLIRQNSSTSYFNYDDKTYACRDSIIVGGFNGYRCVDTKLEYDEETKTYTCTIQYKKIIE